MAMNTWKWFAGTLFYSLKSLDSEPGMGTGTEQTTLSEDTPLAYLASA